MQDYDIPIVDQYVPANVSNIGPGILISPEQSSVIYTAAESYFNQAEAIHKGLMPGDAKAMYQAGIRASFDYLGSGLTGSALAAYQADRDAYIASITPLVSWDNSANKIEAIMNQKCIALMGINALQTWFDYNRTGFPSDVPVSLLASTPDRPVRLAYPSSELTSNTANVPSQPNVFNVKVFWAN